MGAEDVSAVGDTPDEPRETSQQAQKTLFMDASARGIVNVAEIPSLHGLLVLDLSYNNIQTLPGQDFWGQMPWLQVLLLGGNKISDAASTQGLAGLPLIYLDIRGNSMEGGYRAVVMSKLQGLLVLDGTVASCLEGSTTWRAYADARQYNDYLVHQSILTGITAPKCIMGLLELQSRAISAQASSCPVLIVQKHIRGYLAAQCALNLRKCRHGAAVRIQRHWMQAQQQAMARSALQAAHGPQKSNVGEDGSLGRNTTEYIDGIRQIGLGSRQFPVNTPGRGAMGMKEGDDHGGNGPAPDSMPLSQPFYQREPTPCCNRLVHGSPRGLAYVRALEKASTVIQQYMRRYLQRADRYSVPLETSFIKKIAMLCGDDEDGMMAVRERTAVQLLRSNVESRASRVKQEACCERPRDLDGLLVVKGPQEGAGGAAARLSRRRQSDMMQQRYLHCVQRAVALEQRQKTLEENRAKASAVKTAVAATKGLGCGYVCAAGRLRRLQSLCAVGPQQGGCPLADAVRAELVQGAAGGGPRVPYRVAMLLDTAHETRQRNEEGADGALGGTQVRLPQAQEQRLRNAAVRAAHKERAEMTASGVLARNTRARTDNLRWLERAEEQRRARDERAASELRSRIARQREAVRGAAQSALSRRGLAGALGEARRAGGG